MPLANRSSSLLTDHGNHGNKTDNSSLPLYRKFRFCQASDFDLEYRDAQNRHRCCIMQAHWDEKAECLRGKNVSLSETIHLLVGCRVINP